MYGGPYYTGHLQQHHDDGRIRTHAFVAPATFGQPDTCAALNVPADGPCGLSASLHTYIEPRRKPVSHKVEQVDWARRNGWAAPYDPPIVDQGYDHPED
jgi:hypothetical protein